MMNKSLRLWGRESSGNRIIGYQLMPRTKKSRRFRRLLKLITGRRQTEWTGATRCPNEDDRSHKGESLILPKQAIFFRDYLPGRPVAEHFGIHSLVVPATRLRQGFAGVWHWARRSFSEGGKQGPITTGGFDQGKVGQRPCHTMGRGVWVPAPVRDCALGRDDVVRDCVLDLYVLKKLFAASFEARFFVTACCRRSISEFISAMRSVNSSTDSSDRSWPISWVIFFRGLSSSSMAMRFSLRWAVPEAVASRSRAG